MLIIAIFNSVNFSPSVSIKPLVILRGTNGKYCRNSKKAPSEAYVSWIVDSIHRLLLLLFLPSTIKNNVIYISMQLFAWADYRLKLKFTEIGTRMKFKSSQVKFELVEFSLIPVKFSLNPV